MQCFFFFFFFCFFFFVSGEISPNGQCLSNWRNFSVWSFLVAKNFERNIILNFFLPDPILRFQQVAKRL
jgi:hypothetical protein